MINAYAIAAAGELIGERGRAAMLLALMDGRPKTAGELAFAANVSAQSASAHLSKLVGGGLLSVQNEGRHRYYRLAGSKIAHALEALGSIAMKERPAGLPGPGARNDLYLARTCYYHLAGRIAVELTDRLEHSGVIRVQDQRNFELGPRGKRWFEAMDIDVERLRRSRRCFARQCIDWTERRPHLAGILGAALCSRFIALGWIAPRSNTRAVRITHQGSRELHTRFGLKLN